MFKRRILKLAVAAVTIASMAGLASLGAGSDQDCWSIDSRRNERFR
jgi:hypothetical protein